MAGDPWCETGPRDPSLVAVYWSLHCLWLINIFLGSYGCYRLFTNNTMKGNVFKILYLCIAICFFLGAPGFAFGIQAGWECWYNNFRPWEGTYMVGLNGYSYGLALLNLFFMLRLQKVFGSKLSLHIVIKVIFGIGLLIQLICPIIFTRYFLGGWDAYNRTLALRFFNIFTWTNIVSSLLVLIVFIRQILKLSTVHHEPSRTSVTISGSAVVDIEQEMKSNTVEQELLKLITRYMVCASFALLSTLVVVIIGIVRSEVPSLHDDLTIRGIHIFFHILDTTVNLICLCLQFPFGKGWYGKCCKHVDLCASNCFIKSMNLKVKSTANNKIESSIVMPSTLSSKANSNDGSRAGTVTEASV